jgi:fructose-specific phosphotransferase system IIC component
LVVGVVMLLVVGHPIAGFMRFLGEGLHSLQHNGVQDFRLIDRV